MKMKSIVLAICMLLFMSGCSKETLPEVTPTQTIEAYMSALKEQNSVEMAKYTESGQADDFRMSEAECQAMGLSVDVAREFTKIILSFDVTISNEQIQKEQKMASVVVHIQTYDMLQVLETTAEKEAAAFTDIYEGEGEHDEKNQKISSLLLAGFQAAEKNYEADITLHMREQEGVWKLIDTMDALYAELINTAAQA